ncbi:MAG: FAD-dependent oxidoreductase, partial [Myxococcota bacterium]
GAGIAGASLAYRLAERGLAVTVMEREARPGYHASGRSAQVFLTYSDDPFERRVVIAAAEFLRRPPAHFGTVFTASGAVLLFDEPDWAAARDHTAALGALGRRVERLAPTELARFLPDGCADDAAGAIHLPDDGRLDVARLLAGYLDGARARGATVLCGAEVTAITRTGGACTGVSSTAGEVRAPVVVNAAGPWAGAIGALAGATSIAFEPRRRTVLSLAAPPGVTVRDWPLICYESRGLYFAPEGDGLLACPMDEELVAPGDAAPDPAMIAELRRRLAAHAPAIAAGETRATRAGLRTFAPDGRLVIGEDPGLRGFFWLAGQGGWGIESSPVISLIAADLLTGATPTWPEAAALSPARYAT